MSRQQEPARYNMPAGQRAYTQQPPPGGYLYPTPARQALAGLRARWMGCGLLLGLMIGIALTLCAAAWTARPFTPVVENLPGQPDVAIVISQAYLNREAAAKINGSYPTGVPNISLSKLNMTLSPGNRMDLQPTFSVDAVFTNFDLDARVNNQLSVVNGQLALNMVGDPQLGDLNIPLELLPFNLKDSVAQAVDNINNKLILTEMNQTLGSSLNGSSYVVEGVTTAGGEMTIRLHKP